MRGGYPGPPESAEEPSAVAAGPVGGVGPDPAGRHQASGPFAGDQGAYEAWGAQRAIAPSARQNISQHRDRGLLTHGQQSSFHNPVLLGRADPELLGRQGSDR